MARSDQDRKPVELEKSGERTDRPHEVDLFKSMEEDMVFGGQGRSRGIDLRRLDRLSRDDDDRGRW